MDLAIEMGIIVPRYASCNTSRDGTMLALVPRLAPKGECAKLAYGLRGFVPKEARRGLRPSWRCGILCDQLVDIKMSTQDPPRQLLVGVRLGLRQSEGSEHS